MTHTQINNQKYLLPAIAILTTLAMGGLIYWAGETITVTVMFISLVFDFLVRKFPNTKVGKSFPVGKLSRHYFQISVLMALVLAAWSALLGWSAIFPTLLGATCLYNWIVAVE